jgi:hypothetical protein
VVENKRLALLSRSSRLRSWWWRTSGWRCSLGHPGFAAGAGQSAPCIEEAHPSRERAHRGCSRHGRDIGALLEATRREWPQRGDLVPQAIRGGAESAAEGAQRSSRPPR